MSAAQLDLFVPEAAPRKLKRQHGTWNMQTKLQVLAESTRRCFYTVNLDGNDPWWSRGHYIVNCQNVVNHAPRHGFAVGGVWYAA